MNKINKKIRAVISLTLCLLLVISATFIMGAGTVSAETTSTPVNLLTNPELNYTGNATDGFAAEGWSFNKKATMSTEANGDNVLTISTDTDAEYELRTNKNLNLDSKKYYKFSVLYKLTDTASGKFNINNGVWLSYKYNNTHVNKINLTKTDEWKEASFIVYGGNVTAGAWDKFFCARINWSTCALSIKNPSVTEYNPDELDMQQGSGNTNILEGISGGVDITDFTAVTPWGSVSDVVKGSEITTVNVNGKENVPALNLTLARKNHDIYWQYKLIDNGSVKYQLANGKKYKFTVWIKGEDVTCDSYENGGIRPAFRDGTTWNNGTNYTSFDGWQKLEYIIDKESYNTTESRIGIRTYAIGGNFLVADPRLVEYITPALETSFDTSKGTVTLNRNSANEGETVQVKVVANEGYKLASLYYTTDGVNKTDITEKKQTISETPTATHTHITTIYTSVASDKIYTFTMPSCEVATVVANFESLSGEGPGTDTEPDTEPGATLKNVSFELGTGNDFTNWKKNAISGKIEFLSSSDAKDGNRAILFKTSKRSDVATVYQNINNVDSALRYRATVYAKTLVKPDVAYAGGGIKIQITYLDKDGNKCKFVSNGKGELTDWTKVYVDYQIPEGATDVKLNLMVDCLNGEVLFDSVAIEEIGKAVVMPVEDKNNLAPNPSFENGQDGALPGWYYWTNNAKNASLSIGAPRLGAQAAKLTNKTNDCANQISVDLSTLDVTKYYQFSAWVKTEEVQAISAGEGGAYLKVMFKKPGTEENLMSYNTRKIDGTNDWTKLSVIVKFPENCKRAQFCMTFSGASGTVYFDDVDLRAIDYVESNILTNGNFSQVDSNGALKGWQQNTSNKDNTTFTNDKGTAVITNKSNSSACYYQTVKGLKANNTYVLSGKMLTKELSSKFTGAAVLVEFVDANGNLINTIKCADWLGGTFEEWIEFSTRILLPEGCKDIRVLLCILDAKGEARFSNIKLNTEDTYFGITPTEAIQTENIKFEETPDETPESSKPSVSPDNTDTTTTEPDNTILIIILAVIGVFALSVVVATVIVIIKNKKATVN